jgi:aspartate aminotransferase-like enzyme
MIYPPEYLVMIPGPTNVPYRVMQAMLTPIINHRSDDFRVLYRRLQEKLKYTFQTENDIVVLTSSGTGAVEASVVNLIRKGDRAIIPVNGEFSERLAKMIELAGGEAIKVKAPYGKIPSFEQIKEAFDNNNGIKAFYVVYNETSTGTRITWLDRVKSLFARDDTFFVVDAVSNFAGDELPVDRWGVDICVTASQKCIAAPPGVAMLSLSERAKEYIKRDPPSTLYLNLPRYLKYYAESAETPFTPALPLFFALHEALTMIEEEGLENRIRRHRECADVFYREFARMGFEYFSDTECRSNTVIALKYPDGLDDKRFRSTLANEFKVLVAGGFGDMKGKLWRVGCMGEVNTYHVKRTLASVASTLDMLGVRLPAIAGK